MAAGHRGGRPVEGGLRPHRDTGEIRDWLDRLELDTELRKALSKMVLEVKAEIRFRPTDGRRADRRDAKQRASTSGATARIARVTRFFRPRAGARILGIVRARMSTADARRSRPKERCRWDLVSLGEVMLRLDPGDGRVATTRTFQAWEGGGEYNVARGLKRCFGLSTAVVTAFADNPVGRLVQDLIYQGGVDQSYVKWVKYDGVGRHGAQRSELHRARLRRARPRSAARTGATPPPRQLKPGDIDWDKIFGQDGVRWFHTGGIFAALSETTPAGRPGGDGGGQAPRHHRLVRSQLPRVAVEGHRRARPRPAR